MALIQPKEFPSVFQLAIDDAARRYADGLAMHSDEVFHQAASWMRAHDEPPHPDITISGEQRAWSYKCRLSALRKIRDDVRVTVAMAWAQSEGVPLWMIADHLLMNGHPFTPESVLGAAEDFAVMAKGIRGACPE